MERDVELHARQAAALAAANRFLLEVVDPTNTRDERKIAEEIGRWCRGIYFVSEGTDAKGNTVISFRIRFWVYNDPMRTLLVDVVLKKSFQIGDRRGVKKDSLPWLVTYAKIVFWSIWAEVKDGNWRIFGGSLPYYWIEYLRGPFVRS